MPFQHLLGSPGLDQETGRTERTELRLVRLTAALTLVTVALPAIAFATVPANHNFSSAATPANRFTPAPGTATLIGLPVSSLGQSVVATIPVITQRKGPHGQSPNVTSELKPKYGHLPVSFEPNVGQLDDEVAFVAHGNGANVFPNVFLTAQGVVLDLGAPDSVEPAEAQSDESGQATADRVLRLKLLGSNPSILGELELPGRSNYFLGHDPKQRHTDIPTYARVTSKETDASIDLRFHGERGQLEYAFVVAAGANPSLIGLGFDGVDAIDLDDGDLALHTAAGSIRQPQPTLRQEVNGVRTTAVGRSVIDSSRRVGFVTDGLPRPTSALAWRLGGTLPANR